MRGKVMQSLTKSEFERLVALKSHKYKKDVKNEKDANKLKLLVHVGFFEYICSILNKKLSNVIRKQDEKK